MTGFLLDTNAVIALVNQPKGSVAKRLRRHAPHNIFVSSVVMHELFFGAFNRARIEANVDLIDGLAFNVVPFELDDARMAGQVRAALYSLGKPIGPYEVLIAGQAVHRDFTLVTHNVHEFARVPQLRVADWLAASWGSSEKIACVDQCVARRVVVRHHFRQRIFVCGCIDHGVGSTQLIVPRLARWHQSSPQSRSSGR